jgi:hypothetical protein
MAVTAMAMTTKPMDVVHRTTEAAMDRTAIRHSVRSGHGFEPGAARPRTREAHGDGADGRTPHHRQNDAA